jgi:hypothetical protein
MGVWASVSRCEDVRVTWVVVVASIVRVEFVIMS